MARFNHFFYANPRKLLRNILEEKPSYRAELEEEIRDYEDSVGIKRKPKRKRRPSKIKLLQDQVKMLGQKIDRIASDQKKADEKRNKREEEDRYRRFFGY